MKLIDVLNQVNSFEKNSFLRIIDNIISTKPKNFKQIDKLLSQIDGQLKNADHKSVADVLGLIEEECGMLISEEFTNTVSQLDLLIDIIIRDGNSIMKREWLLKLYEKEIKNIKSKTKEFAALLDSDVEEPRIRDYRIYQECVKTAYVNDLKNNQEKKITRDEQSILNSLSDGLELSHEEVKLINYSVIPLVKLDIDEVIKYLTKIGVILYSRKNHQVFVPDEVVSILRKVRGKELLDKTFRRVLRQLKDSQINLLAKKHNIDRKLDINGKIKEIIKEGISFRTALLNGIHKEGTKKSDKRTFLNELIEKKLEITEHIKGTSLEMKLENLVRYLEGKEKDGSISISMGGYEKLIIDLSKGISKFEKMLRDEFELEENTSLDAKKLLMYNIKPADILYLLPSEQLKGFCKKYEVSTRGNEVLNVLEKYKDSENLFLENYSSIAHRDLNHLTENGIGIKESELGIKFEELTKSLFVKLGFSVDEALRKVLSDNKNKADIIIRLKENEIMIVECKSIKEKGYNKYSSVSRQVKAYKNLAEKKDYKVVKTFIIAPEFTDDFVNECGLDYELNLSLITADTLFKIYESFKESSLEEFPLTLLLRDVLINKERVVSAISK